MRTLVRFLSVELQHQENLTRPSGNLQSLGVNQEAGVVFLVKNYGDIFLSFSLALSLAQQEHLPTSMGEFVL